MTISNVLINSKTFRINIFCIEAIEIEERTSENDITKALIDDSLTLAEFPYNFLFQLRYQKTKFWLHSIELYIHTYIYSIIRNNTISV